MRPAPWRSLPDADEDTSSNERTSPVLVSLDFLWTALRRHPVVFLLSPVLGLLLAAGVLVAFPPAHAAKATLVLPSDSQVDPTKAMATNVSLLATQTLAKRTTDQLGLTMSPDTFVGTITIQAESSDLMTLTLTAPTDAEAVRRLSGLTSTFLAFRAEQLSFQSEVLVKGLDDRIAGLQGQIADLTKKIADLGPATTANSTQYNQYLTQQAVFRSQVETLQQQVEDQTLKTGALVASGRVLDPAAVVPGRALKTTALALVSGLVGGTALGWGTVLFFAVTSDRLRRRADVATVLGAPVGASVRRVDPLPSLLRHLPPFVPLQRRRLRECARLASALEAQLLVPGQQSRLVVARADDRDDVSHAVAQLARALVAAGRDVTVVDVTERGSKVLRGKLPLSDPGAPPVLRPDGTPALASGPDELSAVGSWEGAEDASAPQLGDVVITLADLEPAVGAAHLRSWAERAVIAVSTGGASAERLRTVADQVRAAGLDVRCAVLLRTDRTDNSRAEPVTAPVVAPVQLLDVLTAGLPASERYEAR
ncbi:MAG TPA: hypothetical protein VGC37_06770 [Friedmanniella sp.]